uniref:lectin-like n=1 Tax=Styela clava TaxID=7725 RepID=UPI00193A3E52|nr:lectin-like [Styela clava]
MKCSLKIFSIFIWFLPVAQSTTQHGELCVTKWKNGHFVTEGSCQSPTTNDIVKQLKQKVYKNTWYVATNNFSYKLFHDKVSYETAQYECQKRGANLAAAGIRDPAVRSELMPLIKEAAFDTWIGLDDIQQEGKFVWKDGVTSTREKTYWFVNQPDNQGGIEDCAHFRPHYDWMLNDEPCSKHLKFFCERRN